MLIAEYARGPELWHWIYLAIIGLSTTSLFLPVIRHFYEWWKIPLWVRVIAGIGVVIQFTPAGAAGLATLLYFLIMLHFFPVGSPAPLSAAVIAVIFFVSSYCLSMLRMFSGLARR